jgi:hypothetical protein
MTIWMNDIINCFIASNETRQVFNPPLTVYECHPASVIRFILNGLTRVSQQDSYWIISNTEGNNGCRYLYETREDGETQYNRILTAKRSPGYTWYSLKDIT